MKTAQPIADSSPSLCDGIAGYCCTSADCSADWRSSRGRAKSVVWEEQLSERLAALIGNDKDECEIVISTCNGKRLKQRFGDFFEWTSQHLSPCEQQVFVLLPNGNDNKEIARLTGRRSNVVKVLLHRAKSKLRQAWKRLKSQTGLQDEELIDWHRASLENHVNQEGLPTGVSVDGVCCDCEAELIGDALAYGYEATLAECVRCGYSNAIFTGDTRVR